MSRPTLSAPQLLWDADRGVPYSAQFDDVYHTASGALAQARHVFMGGCGLPQRWQKQHTFAVIETGFGLGLNFLATWQAWLLDPLRCSHLYFVSVEAFPVSAADIVRAVQQSPDLQDLAPLAQQLARHYPQPPSAGVHRLVFTHPDDPRHSITLTLAFGDAAQMLPQLRLQADAAYLDGFSPAKNPELWQPRIFKAVARLLKPQAIAATWSVAALVRKGLTEAGFIVTRRPGLPPKRDALQATYVPWSQRASTSTAAVATTANASPASTASAIALVQQTPPARHIAIIGAGMAGAAACHAMSRRGWRVTLIDAGGGPATGASGLPVGLCVPHVSPDDAFISRLTRAGTAWMRQMIELPALPADAWRECGVWQVLDGEEPEGPQEDGQQSSTSFDDAAWQRRIKALSALEASIGTISVHPDASLPGGYEGPVLQHPHGLCIKGKPLVQHWLDQCDNLTCHWNSRVERLEQNGLTSWRVMGADDQLVTEADAVIVATAMNAPQLIQNAIALTPLRGQITLGKWPTDSSATSLHTEQKELEKTAITGHGHFIPDWSHADGESANRDADSDHYGDWDWAMGSSFERDDSDTAPRPASDLVNLAKLRHIVPHMADALAPQFKRPIPDRPQGLQPWAQVRATTADRLPLAGAVPDWRAAEALAPHGAHAAATDFNLDTLPRVPGLYVLCGMGARGLSLSALCAELIASQIDGNPLPLEAPLAHALDPARFELRQRRQS